MMEQRKNGIAPEDGGERRENKLEKRWASGQKEGKEEGARTKLSSISGSYITHTQPVAYLLYLPLQQLLYVLSGPCMELPEPLLRSTFISIRRGTWNVYGRGV